MIREKGISEVFKVGSQQLQNSFLQILLKRKVDYQNFNGFVRINLHIVSQINPLTRSGLESNFKTFVVHGRTTHTDTKKNVDLLIISK